MALLLQHKSNSPLPTLCENRMVSIGVIYTLAGHVKQWRHHCRSYYLDILPRLTVRAAYLIFRQPTKPGIYPISICSVVPKSHTLTNIKLFQTVPNIRVLDVVNASSVSLELRIAPSSISALQTVARPGTGWLHQLKSQHHFFLSEFTI